MRYYFKYLRKKKGASRIVENWAEMGQNGAEMASNWPELKTIGLTCENSNCRELLRIGSKWAQMGVKWPRIEKN